MFRTLLRPPFRLTRPLTTPLTTPLKTTIHITITNSLHSITSSLPYSQQRQPYSLTHTLTHLPTPHQYSPLRCFSRYTQDYYSVIGVTKSATQAEIKREYFRKAKKYHPDLNPNDKNAVRKFQELATAYETLSNPQKRLEYDNMGYKQYSQQTSRHQQQYGQASPPDPNEVFNTVYQDFEIIQSAWYDYLTETKEDFTYACKEADNNNWTPMYDIAKANSVLIVGIVVPVAIVLRMPSAIAVALRFALPIVSAVGMGIIRTGNSGVFAAYLWRKLVEIARNRKKRTRRP